jgi:plasmid replication initiation protein
MDLTPTNRHYARQSPTLVNSNYSLTKAESDLVFAVLTEIKKEDEDFKDYVFTKAELELKLGMEMNSKQLDKVTEKLMNRPAFKFTTKKGGWGKTHWFSYCGYEDGVATFTFDKRLKPYLLELKQFVLADIRQLTQMRSEYSRRIYLMLKERLKFGERKFQIDELMETLQVPKSYKNYADFKRKVLEQSVKDINKFTDIEVAYTEKKKVRKVISVTFSIKKNWNDLKSFIAWIRELYTNQPLYEGKDGRMLKCSEKGLLYYADDVMEWLDEKTAQKAWEWLFEHREKLYCFQPNLLDFAEPTDTPKAPK